MNSEGFKVLICDDSMLVREELKDILTESDVETVLEAANGKEALLLIEEYKPQVMFLDIVMPIMNGFDTLKEIRKNDFKTKVIMISSFGTQTHLKTALEEGADDFVKKPWKRAEILTIIERIRQEEDF